MGRIENINDIVGNTYGKIEVIKYLGCYREFTAGCGRLRQVYLCKCNCGEIQGYTQRLTYREQSKFLWMY